MEPKFIELSGGNGTILVNISQICSIDISDDKETVSIHSAGNEDPVQLDRGTWDRLYDAQFKRLVAWGG
jgi:hypothetical protein